MSLVTVSENKLNDVKGALNIARDTVRVAEQALVAAKDSLEQVKRLYQVGVKASSLLTKFAATQIITIRRIYFRAGLSVVSEGRFMCNVNGVLKGQQLNKYLQIDVRNMSLIITAVSKILLPGLEKFIF